MACVALGLRRILAGVEPPLPQHLRRGFGRLTGNPEETGLGVADDRLGAVAKRCAVSEDLSAAGHITSSGVTRPGAAKFTALKRFPEADRTDGGRLILSIDEVCFTDCHLSDRPFSPPLICRVSIAMLSTLTKTAL